jgi:signal transduction histidine kinase
MVKNVLDERLLRALLENQPEAVVYYTPVGSGPEAPVDFEVAFCNREAAFQTGIDSEQLTGQHVLHMVHTDDKVRRTIFDQLYRVYKTGEPSESTYYNPVLNKHFSLLRTKVEDGVLSLARNVSSEIRTGEEKDKSMAFTNSLLDAAINGIYACEAIRNEAGEITDLMMLRINKAFTRIIKKTEAEVIGKTFLTLFPSSRENGAFAMNCEVIQTGQPLRREVYYEGDGIDGWYDVSIAKLGTDCMVVNFSDITPFKRVQLKVEGINQTMEQVFNAAQMGMFTFRPKYDSNQELVDFYFSMANEGIASYVGQKPEALRNEPGSKWFPGYLTNGVFDMYKETYLTGLPNRKEVHYNVDGHDLYLDLQSRKIDGEVLVTFTDHTALRQAQMALEKTIDELKRTNANLEEFAYAASHDMQEPIRKIHYFSNRIREQFSQDMDPAALRYFERLEAATDRMRHLVDDLLAYSQVTHRPSLFEEVDLNAKVQAVLEDLELTIAEKDPLIEVGPLPVTLGHRRQLQQLFQNLIGNALKYSKPGVRPEIRIQSRSVQLPDEGFMKAKAGPGAYHLIEISDNGIGFEQKDADKIFNVFTRLHGNAEYRGTGVGLSIVRKVAENHNGYIVADGVPGEGATFRLYLPAGQERTELPATRQLEV